MAARGTFLYEELADVIAGLISGGTLTAGDRLPSVRRMSRQRGVSMATVLQAYRRLEDRRLVEARPQSGFYVRPQVADRPVEPTTTAPPRRPSAVQVSRLIDDVIEGASDASLVPLGAAIPSPDLLPTARLGRMLAAVARQAPPEAYAYLPPQGHADLRHEIARRSLDWGFPLAADDIVVTSGCMEALTLCLQTLTQRGEAVAVESPTYFGVLQLLEHLGLQAREVATHPRHGVCLDALDEALADDRVTACLLTPNYHNPLGSCMPDAHKQAAVEMAARHRVPIIEDDLYGDLFFAPPRPKPLKAFDADGWVLHCSSFSKTLAPGYRIGWAVPGRYYQAVRRGKLATTIATAAPLQLAVAAFLRAGGYDHHLRGLRRAFAHNLERMTQAVSAAFPEGTRVTRPGGGFVLWVEMPEGYDALTLHRRARQHHISIAPGPIFSSTGAYGTCIRLNGGYPWDEAIEEALATLGRLTNALPSYQG